MLKYLTFYDILQPVPLCIIGTYTFQTNFLCVQVEASNMTEEEAEDEVNSILRRQRKRGHRTERNVSHPSGGSAFRKPKVKRRRKKKKGEDDEEDLTNLSPSEAAKLNFK